MPYYKMYCVCGRTMGVLADSFDVISDSIKTCPCGKMMSRSVKAPSTAVMERLDNGSMVRALERYSDAEELFRKRHEEADPLAGTRPNRS